MKSSEFTRWPHVDWRPITPGKVTAHSTPLRNERRMSKHIYPDYDDQARFSIK